MSAAWVAIAVCAMAVLGLLAFESRGVRFGVWLTKPLAAACFLAAALAFGALDSGYGRTVLAGLVLCALGDVLLIPRTRPLAFQLGIGAFLLGHVAYAIAFAGLRPAPAALAAAALVMALFAFVVLRWLGPQVPADFRIPVRAYVAVISVMVALAIGASSGGATIGIAAGAIGFAASDLSVARDRFIAPAFTNAAWGLPLYFASQLVLASTVASLSTRAAG